MTFQFAIGHISINIILLLQQNGTELRTVTIERISSFPQENGKMAKMMMCMQGV